MSAVSGKSGRRALRSTSNGLNVAERQEGVEDGKAATVCGDPKVPGALLASKVLRAQEGLEGLRYEQG